jgi:hypothetical protein
MIKVSVILELNDQEGVYFLEKHLEANYDVKDFRILPNTDDLWEKDDVFKRLCKGVKDAQRIRDSYINQNNF